MENRLVIIFIGMALVTYIPRMLPVVTLSRVEMPEIIMKWLHYIPISILSALLLPALLAPEGELFLSFRNHFLLAAAPTGVVGIKTRSLVKTVTAGIIFMFLLHNYWV